MKMWPDHPGRIRWLPRHGEPVCILEWVSQLLVRSLAWAPLYTAVIVTLTFLAVIAIYLWGGA